MIKIVRGQFNKDLLKTRNSRLSQLLYSMLDLDPNKRPTVDTILTESFVVCSLVDLYQNIGAVEVK